MKIFANTIVNNEENFVWFAVMSIVDYVDKVLIWDTGSTDKTVKIINEIKRIKGSKILFKEVGKADDVQFTKLRQKMLEESKCDWILIVDGDEIWWEKSIRMLIKKIKKKKNTAGVVVPVKVCVGDIYHVQDESAGRYEILGRRGHFNLRAINRNVKGLHVDMPHPQEGYFDSNNKLVQQRKDIIFLDTPYLHLTHLKRSSKEVKLSKFKYEIGTSFKVNEKLPEILYKLHPSLVTSPWVRLKGIDLLKASILTPFRKIKRKFD